MARNSYYQSAHWRALKRATHERDGWRCVVPGCGSSKGIVCDHIRTRPNVDHPTPFDVLTNTRTLCGTHDRKVKETASGQRRGGGALFVQGTDEHGRPRDPAHPWNRPRP
ncbi:HNH endonuclease signature motif containing protein [Ancylobacter sonchi]